MVYRYKIASKVFWQSTLTFAEPAIYCWNNHFKFQIEGEKKRGVYTKNEGDFY